MNTMQEKNDLAFLLHRELLKAAEKFTRKCQKANDPEVILGAGNMYMIGFLLNAPDKEAARKTLDDCYQVMKSMLDKIPGYEFDKAKRNNINMN